MAGRNDDNQEVREWCWRHDLPIGTRGAIAAVVVKAFLEDDPDTARAHFRSYIKRGIKTRLSIEQFRNDTREQIVSRLEGAGVCEAEELADTIIAERRVRYRVEGEEVIK